MEKKKVKHSKPVRINKGYDIISVIVGSIVCLFHVLGISLPGWWVLEDVDARGSNMKYYFGVWSTRTCHDDLCVTDVARMTEERAWLIGPAVLILLAGLLLVAVVVLIVVTVIKSWGAPVRKLCVLLSAGSCGIVILAVLIFVKKKAGLRPSTAPETSDGTPVWTQIQTAPDQGPLCMQTYVGRDCKNVRQATYPEVFSGWTLIISTVGAILALINAFIISIGVSKNFKSEHPPTDQLNMEIHVNGAGPRVSLSTDQGTRWQIQKKEKGPRRGSGMVYYTPDFRETSDKL